MATITIIGAGIITDGVAAADWGVSLAARLSLQPEQLGMKCGLLVGALFPLAGILVYAAFLCRKRKMSGN